jgi:hypothetical protein
MAQRKLRQRNELLDSISEQYIEPYIDLSDTENNKILARIRGKSEDKVDKKKKKKDEIIENIKENDLKTMNFINELKLSLDKQIEELKELKDKIKKVEQLYESDLVKAYKSKKTKRESVEYGIQKKKPIPDNLASMLKLEKSTELSLPQLSKYIYGELKNRNLMYPQNKRIFRVDEELSRVLEIPLSVNKYTEINENGFNYKNIQSHLLRILKKNLKT